MHQEEKSVVFRGDVRPELGSPFVLMSITISFFMALAEFLCQSCLCCQLDPRLHRPLAALALGLCTKKLKVVYFCLQVAGTQVLKEAGKPVRVAESDVDVSPSMSFTCPSHLDLNMTH